MGRPEGAHQRWHCVHMIPAPKERTVRAKLPHSTPVQGTVCTPQHRPLWTTAGTYIVKKDVARGPLEHGHLLVARVPAVDGLGVHGPRLQHRGDVASDAVVQDVALGSQLGVAVHH
jgi:hypothetical protein